MLLGWVSGAISCRRCTFASYAVELRDAVAEIDGGFVVFEAVVEFLEVDCEAMLGGVGVDLFGGEEGAVED